MFDALRWLLEQPAMPTLLTEVVTGQTIPVLDLHDEVLHVPDGCRQAAALPDGKPGQIPAHPGPGYRRATLGQALDGTVAVCEHCAQMHLSVLLHSTHPDAGPDWVIAKDIAYRARHLRELEAWLAGPVGHYADVPWGVTRFRLPVGHSAAMWEATGQLNDHVASRIAALVDRLTAQRPGWLHVRYAAEQADLQVPGLSGFNRNTVVSGFDLHNLDDDARAALDGLVTDVEARTASEPSRPVLVRHRRSAIALRDRHLVRPLETIPTGPDTHVDVLAVPASIAPHAGGDDERFRLDWLDVHDGWADDPQVRDRIRAAATLWGGGRDNPFARLAMAWEAAGALAG